MSKSNTPANPFAGKTYREGFGGLSLGTAAHPGQTEYVRLEDALAIIRELEAKLEAK